MIECDLWMDKIDNVLLGWRQGDVSQTSEMEFLHLANPSCPNTAAAAEISSTNEELAQLDWVPIAERIDGIVVLTQTCDIVRSWRDRPYVEISPLAKVADEVVEQARQLKRPVFAYIPSMAENGFVADLDRVMTIEKSVLASLPRIPGCSTDEECRAFSYAIARKRSRFAFPDDFVSAASGFRRRILKKHNRNNVEGRYLRALREIRVCGKPSWNHRNVELTL